MSTAPITLNHLLRIPLAAEVHSRPSLRLEANENLTHLAVYTRNLGDGAADQGEQQHELLVSLCQNFGVSGPNIDAKYFFHDFGSFRLQWECHTEFTTFTFAEEQAAPLPLPQAFEQVP